MRRMRTPFVRVLLVALVGLGAGTAAWAQISDRAPEAAKAAGNDVAIGSDDDQKNDRKNKGEKDDPKGGRKEDGARPAQSDDFQDVGFDKYVPSGQEHVGEMRAMLERGLAQLKKARDRKDAVEITCVNEEVTSMKGVLRVAEDAMVALQEDVATDAKGRARADYRKIVTLKRRMEKLLERAQQCVGIDTTVSSTSVEFDDGSYDKFDPYYGDESLFFDPRNAVENGRNGTGNVRGAAGTPPLSDFYLF
jgi:hypothetical protein